MWELFLNKTWGYVKPHIVPVLLSLGVLITCWYVFSRQRDTYMDSLLKHRETYDEQIKKIVEAQVREREQREENFKKLQGELELTKKVYEDSLKELQEKKSKQVNQLVQKYKDDPTGMAQQLSDITGFQLVTPGK